MSTDDSHAAAADREAELLADLSRPDNLLPAGWRGSGSDRVSVERTHGSLVFLIGDDVFKLKRAVDFGFFDFTTLEARRLDCHAEVRLNCRTAPAVYLGVSEVYHDADGYSLNRTGGEVVDYVVHMRRLPNEARASCLLQRGTLDAERLDELARYVAAFYASADCHPAAPAELRGNFEENFAQSRSSGLVGQFITPAACDELDRLQRDWFDRGVDALQDRGARDGHGDLRLEHVYYLPEGPTAIDCIEFADRFRIADPALDVAFFAMELYRELRGDLAETFLGSFAYAANDYDFYPLVDGYMSYRAVVRAKVAGFVAIDDATPIEHRERKSTEARNHFALARQLLEPRQGARIIAVGGLPASGKSTVARWLRPMLQAPVVSADSTRKNLAGVTETQHAGPEAYRKEFSDRVLDEVLRRASRVLDSGRTVVIDSTFRSRAVRSRVREFARQRGVPFTLIECVAPVAELRERIRRRRGDVSDADEAVLDRFLTSWEPITELAAGEHAAFSTDRPLATQRVELNELANLQN